MALKDAVSTVLSRNAFYRDGYRLLLRISIIQGLIIVLLSGAIITMLLAMDTRFIYFATSTDGRIINIVPLNEPYRTPADVVRWSALKAQEVMRFGFSDYRQRLQESANNFTPSGWESFTKALKEARILEAVEARKLVVTLDIEAAPEIRRKFVRDGVYTWDLLFPVVIKFDGLEPPGAIRANLVLRVVRVSTLQNSEGISIEQWIVSN